MISDALRTALEFITGRQRAYQQTFGPAHASRVLTDLYVFCRAGKSCFHEDPRVNAALEGRREVWLRIEQHLKLSPEELLAIANGQRIVEGEKK